MFTQRQKQRRKPWKIVAFATRAIRSSTFAENFRNFFSGKWSARKLAQSLASVPFAGWVVWDRWDVIVHAFMSRKSFVWEIKLLPHLELSSRTGRAFVTWKTQCQKNSRILCSSTNLFIVFYLYKNFNLNMNSVYEEIFAISFALCNRPDFLFIDIFSHTSLELFGPS